MSSTHTLSMLIVGLVVGSAMGAESGPITLGDERQLFIDDYVVGSLEGVSKTLHQPAKHPANPLLDMVPKGDPAWENGMPLHFSNILFDEEEHRFKMWYSLHEKGKSDPFAVLAYATSQDGIQWDKPSLGLHKYRGTLDNNVVIPHEGLECGIFKDPHETDPAKRFKMLYGNIRAAYSPDGLHWTDYNQGKRVIFHSPGHDAQTAPYWDERLGKYVAIIRDRLGNISKDRPQLVTDPTARATWIKLWAYNRTGRVPENHSIRRVGQVESDDFIHWTPMRTVVAADEADPLNQDQFYNMQVLVYEGLRIGLMTVYSLDPDYCRGAVQLTYSRDGMHWHRGGNRDVFIPNSDRPADIDWGQIYPLHAPIVREDEIWIYYTAYTADHNHTMPPGVAGFPCGICLAKLRLDGFVSVDAGASEGTLTTKPLVFHGEKLVINADAASGQLVAELLDADGKPIQGFGKRDCDGINTDKIRHTVSWNGNSDLLALAGKVIKVKFYLRETKLYSFALRN